jgi:hypothetical protein
MSEAIINDLPSLNGLITETDITVNETGINNEDEETWLYGSMKNKFLFLLFFLFIDNKSKNDENM